MGVLSYGSILESMGYTKNPHDIFVFNKWHESEQLQSTIIIYVDDLMITCTSDEILDSIIEQLRERFGDVSENTGESHSYLGLLFDFSEQGRVKITMPGYINDMMSKFNVTGTQQYPTKGDLFKRDENSPPLDDYFHEELHSRVYSVAYMAQRIKPECLPIVSELSSIVKYPTSDDWYKLEHLLQYINGCKDIGMCLEIPSGPIVVNASIDSSH
jgi:hypothetical protein